MDGISLSIVVEIGKNVQSVGEISSNLRSASREELGRVTATLVVAVKAQVDPAGRHQARMIFDHVMNAESTAVLV